MLQSNVMFLKYVAIYRFTSSMNEDNCILLKELERFQFQFHNTVTQLSTCLKGLVKCLFIDGNYKTLVCMCSYNVNQIVLY